MRVSILEAMIDLGISSNWGQTRLSRWISSLPLPTPIAQAISNIYQKKGRLALTALALTLAVATFMGVTAMANSLESLVNRLHEAYGYQIAVTPQDPLQARSLVDNLKAGLPSDKLYTGYNVSIGIEGFRSTNPLAEGSSQLTATGIDPTEHAIVFDLVEGEGWQNDPTRRGVIVSRTLANNMNESLGDSLNLVISGRTITYPIIGIDNYGFDALYINWRDLAIASGHVDESGQPLAGIYYVNLADQDATIETVDDEIDITANQMQTNGIQAAYNNQLRVVDNQSQQINLFGVVFNATSLIMAAVGAIGLAASLSMNVFERQKEIGVMRSIGAGSLSIISQFLLEGVLVGILAWLVAIPLSILLEFSLLATLPFDYVEFAYPPQILAYGLVGVVVIAALASLWPSVMASRKTVSEILRYR
jgi:putative ABC transport system permease protein